MIKIYKKKEVLLSVRSGAAESFSPASLAACVLQGKCTSSVLPLNSWGSLESFVVFISHHIGLKMYPLSLKCFEHPAEK